MRLSVGVALTILLAACSGPRPSESGRAALSERSVRVAGESWTVLVAPPDGMRGRAGFDDADGMLFDLGEVVDPTAVAFVMDGVAFPLDIAWFDGDGALVGTATMPICAAEPCPLHRAPGRYRWAIEAPAGALTSLEPGDRLDVEHQARPREGPAFPARRPLDSDPTTRLGLIAATCRPLGTGSRST